MLNDTDICEVSRLKWLAANRKQHIDFETIEWVCNLAIELNTELKQANKNVTLLQGQVQQMEADCESWEKEQRYP